MIVLIVLVVIILFLVIIVLWLLKSRNDNRNDSGLSEIIATPDIAEISPPIQSVPEVTPIESGSTDIIQEPLFKECSTTNCYEDLIRQHKQFAFDAPLMVSAQVQTTFDIGDIKETHHPSEKQLEIPTKQKGKHNVSTVKRIGNAISSLVTTSTCPTVDLGQTNEVPSSDVQSERHHWTKRFQHYTIKKANDRGNVNVDSDLERAKALFATTSVTGPKEIRKETADQGYNIGQYTTDTTSTQNEKADSIRIFVTPPNDPVHEREQAMTGRLGIMANMIRLKSQELQDEPQIESSMATLVPAAGR